MKNIEEIILGLAVMVFVFSCGSGDAENSFDETVADETITATGVDTIMAQNDTSGTIKQEAPTEISEPEKERIQELKTKSELSNTECCQEWKPEIKVKTCCCDSLIKRYAYALKSDLNRALFIMEEDPYYPACKDTYKKYQQAIDRLESSAQ